ncbi:uncharacterized protein LOC114759876 [Neltuma alba]|uniref:uncharacterized protein LOC114759876 n=1 Tax=Neltuma alba TaxID=207710 RepID=UPI0010A2F730|nr:uncharacterized protein LOC114759876 [Prosopis alba]
MDNKELQRGHEISPTLVKAIENSRIAIIVFSKNYTSSTWYLEELVKILSWAKSKDRLVYPVFYNVDLLEVQHQRGHYGAELAKHEEKLKGDNVKVQQWKSALYEASNLVGGIGQATLARAVYNFIVDRFEGEKNTKLGDSHKGIPILIKKLYCKKVLLILDDVDKLEQLKKLAGDCKSAAEWEVALDRYEKVPNEEIMNTLRVSFDSLKPSKKQVFLDISCIFVGEELAYVEVLYACGYGYMRMFLKFSNKICWSIIEDHVWLSDLRAFFLDSGLKGLFLEHEWNHVEISCEDCAVKNGSTGKEAVKFLAIYMYREERRMENVRFPNSAHVQDQGYRHTYESVSDDTYPIV